MRIEQPNGHFYLGTHSKDKTPLFYDMRDLTTHAVCVGMTGSGKTGLGIGLLEEAALADVPALIIDPKGDMTNLLLTFPDLEPASFRPWVDPDGARRRDLTLDQYAERVATSWREGLARNGIDGDRIAQLRSGTDFTIYTPGSDAGHKISIVESLRCPDLNWDEAAESLRETISGTVSALLALAQIENASTTDREHILMANIIEHAWKQGQDIDLAQLIAQIQDPPFEQLGVLPLEVFYPEKERTDLTLAVNGLLASPSFAAWLQGDALDIDSLLRTPEGKNRMSIFYLAHLSDAERMFFVTLLLETVRTWVRRQPGTSSLRSLLYFDELYGFMPPYPSNPPTKAPLLALLKQARAQGLGLVLMTQNPIDLDYKGLSNTGTWFIGRLQTANDRRRLLEGMDAAEVSPDASLDDLIAGLDQREFLLNNVHEESPALFRTRWVMSYLRGPLTRPQVRKLVGPESETTVVKARQPARATAPETPASPPHKIISRFWMI